MPTSWHPPRRAVHLSSSAPTHSTGRQTERPRALCTLQTAEEREKKLARDALTIDLTLTGAPLSPAFVKLLEDLSACLKVLFKVRQKEVEKDRKYE